MESNKRFFNPAPISGVAAAHVVYPLTDGSLFVFGRNDFGQLGLGHMHAIKVPVQLKIPVPIVEVACGSCHTLLRGQDGSVWGMGSNMSGQLGLESQKKSCVTTPQKILNRGAKSIACGAFFSMILLESGYVMTSGENNCGQLGSINHPRYSFLMLIHLPSIQQISCGLHFAMALAEDGTLYTWGLNDMGQLGLKVGIKSQFLPTKVDDLSSVTVVDIGCGGDFAMALTDQKELYCWGNNNDGQLNPDLKKFWYYPRPKLCSVKGFDSISCGSNHCVAVCSLKNICLTWGIDTYGQSQLRNNYFAYYLDGRISCHCGFTLLRAKDALIVWGWDKNFKLDVFTVPLILKMPIIQDPPHIDSSSESDEPSWSEPSEPESESESESESDEIPIITKSIIVDEKKNSDSESESESESSSESYDFTVIKKNPDSEPVVIDKKKDPDDNAKKKDSDSELSSSDPEVKKRIYREDFKVRHLVQALTVKTLMSILNRHTKSESNLESEPEPYVYRCPICKEVYDGKIRLIMCGDCRHFICSICAELVESCPTCKQDFKNLAVCYP